MAFTLEQTIEQKQQTWHSALFNSQTFWVLIAIVLACMFLSYSTDAFLTS
jgi:ribose transport system permease protein